MQQRKKNAKESDDDNVLLNNNNVDRRVFVDNLKENWKKYKQGVSERKKIAMKAARIWLRIAIVCTGIGIITLLFTP